MAPGIGNRGFTLLELVVVMAILSIMAVIALPKMTGVFNPARKSSGLVATYISAAADYAFIERKTCYLAVHLNSQGEEFSDLPEGSLKSNGLSTYLIEKGKFSLNKRKILSPRELPSSFVMESVILHGGRTISEGTVLLPFYPDGTSSAFTVRARSDGKSLFIIKNRTWRKPLISDSEDDINQ